MAEVVQEQLKESRSQLLERFDARLTASEKIFETVLKKEFRLQKKEYMLLLFQKDIVDTISARARLQEQWSDHMKKELKPIYVDMYKKNGKIALSQLGIGISFNLDNPRARHMVGASLQHIDDINQTTINRLTKDIRDGMANGLSISDIAKNIENVWEDAIGYRATMITRTEVLGAQNGGAYLGYGQSGVVKATEWMTAGDSRVRPSHRVLDGYIVPFGRPFPNGLLYPGDPMGAVEEVVGCRCATAGVTDARQISRIPPPNIEDLPPLEPPKVKPKKKPKKR